MNDESTVFLVDDDPAVLRSLAALVRAVFPRVASFASGAEFLAAYQPESAGCLVLDVAMPDMSGLELQRRLADQKAEIPIIFITGHGNVRMAVDAMQAGAISFLEKPFHEQELWGCIRRAMAVDLNTRRRRQRRAAVEGRLTQLTPGEQDVLKLILDGRLNKEIASQLDISVRTVEDRRARIMRKMQVESLAELVQLALVQ